MDRSIWRRSFRSRSSSTSGRRASSRSTISSYRTRRKVMADAPKGYGPPRIESFRAVRLAVQESSLLADAQTERAPLLRFEVRAEEAFMLRAMPLMIQVGERGYLAAEMSADGRTIA